MPKTDRLLNRGISFAKTGKEENARSLFLAVINEEPQNQLAWGWYVQSFSNDAERINAFDEYLGIFPEDQKALRLQFELIKGQNAHLEKLAADTKQEVEWVQKESEQKIRKQNNATTFIRAILSGIILILVSIIYVVNTKASKEIDHLSGQVKSLTNSYDTLKATYQLLSDEYTSIVQQYQTLFNDHNILLADHNRLTEEHSSLTEVYNNLAGEHSALQYEHDELNRIAVKPPYIVIHDRSIETVFYSLNDDLIYWITPFSHLEHYLDKGHNLRNNMMNLHMYTYTVYTDGGSMLGIRDYTVFFDTNSYSKVIAEIYNQSASSHDFIVQVWQIIVQLNNYASEENETPRFPSETLFAGGGDCEDLSILFASLIKSAPTNWYVEIVYVDSDNILNPQKHDHQGCSILKPILLNETSEVSQQAFRGQNQLEITSSSLQ